MVVLKQVIRNFRSVVWLSNLMDELKLFDFFFNQRRLKTNWIIGTVLYVYRSSQSRHIDKLICTDLSFCVVKLIGEWEETTNHQIHGQCSRALS